MGGQQTLGYCTCVHLEGKGEAEAAHYHFQKGFLHTEVSELIRSTNLFDLGSIISSVMARWGNEWTVHRRDTSPCLNWNTVPLVKDRERSVSQIRAHD